MKQHTTAVTHPAHDRLLQLKLKGANHLARVLDSDAPEPTKLKAAMALARLALPAPPAAPLPLQLPAGEGRGEGEHASDPQTSAAAANTHAAPSTEPQLSDPRAANTAAAIFAPRPLAPNDSAPCALAAKHTLLQRNLAQLPGAATHRPRIKAHPALSP